MSLKSRLNARVAAVLCVLSASLLFPAVGEASFSTRCAGCHGGTVNSLPNGTKISGSIRAANNRAYLDAMIAGGMTSAASVPTGERDGIVAEIAGGSSVAAANITSAAPGGGTFGVFYSHTVTASGAPQLALGATSLGGDPLPNAFTISSGALPPGLAINGSSGVISGVPNTGGTFTGTISAWNRVGAASNQSFSITIIVPPSNDNFASRATISGGSVLATGSNTAATKQAGEPNIFGNAGGHSLWWTWTAPSSTAVTLTTFGSSFDTLLGVYTGTAVGSLTLVASNDDCTSQNTTPLVTCPAGEGNRSALTFTATAGTSYQIAVDGYNGATGSIHLNLDQPQTLTITHTGAAGTVTSSPAGINCTGNCSHDFPANTVVTLTATPSPGNIFIGFGGLSCGRATSCPVTMSSAVTTFANFTSLPNDNFVDRTIVNPIFPGGSGYNISATKEAGEPNHAFNAGGASVWWSWTPTKTGAVNISTNASYGGFNSDFDTTLAVYTGNAVNALTLVASNDDFTGAQSSVTFQAVAGTEYQIAVDGYNGATGAIYLTIHQPGGDNFINRLNLTGGTISVTDSNVGAAKETGEPAHFGNTGGHSLWWSWTAPTTGSVTMDTVGSDFDTVMAVYTGFSVNSLTQVAANDDAVGVQSRVTFAATAGTIYQIAVDGYNNGSNGGLTGNVTLNILQQQPQTITFANPGVHSFSATPLLLTASATSGLTVVFTTTTPLVCSVAGASVTMISTGFCTINANQPGNASYFAAPQVGQSFLLSQGPQTIVFPAQGGQVFSPGGTFAINPLATSDSGLAITYNSTTLSVCTVSGSVVTIVAAGTCNIAADQPGNSNYLTAAQVVVPITIAQAAQTITFGAQAGQSYAPGGTFSVNPLATTTSGLAVTYGSTTSVCTVAGTTVTIVNSGTCTISANQAGNANYLAAAQATQSLTIAPVAPGAPVIGAATPGDTQAAIGFSAPANNGGSPITGYQATCNPGAITASGSVSPINVSGLTNSVLYTCSVKAINAVGPGSSSAGVSVTPTAAATAPNITSLNNTSFTVNAAGTFTVTATGTPAPTLSLTGTLPTGINFVAGTGVLSGTAALGTVGSYPLTVQASNASGSPTQSFTLTIAKANQTISFTGPGAQSFSNATIPVSATATSSLAVSFSSTTPGTCSVTGSNVTMIAVGTCTIAANQAGDGNYNAAPQVTQNFNIGQGSQSITFPVQGVTSRAFTPGGTFAISPTATATSGLAISYSSTTTGVCTVSGTTVTMVSAGTCTMAADQAGNVNYSAATQATRSVTITATVPGAPTIGTATPGNTQVTIAFTPPAANGGSAITGYTATCNPGAVTGNSGTSPVTVSGLTNNTAYTCTVVANNAIGASAPSASVMVTPVVPPGQVIFDNVCTACHTDPPVGPRFNAAGSSNTVLTYVIPRQPLMSANTAVKALTPSDLTAIALYLQEQMPLANFSTSINTPKLVDVSGNLTLNTISFDAAEVVTPPSNGALSTFSGSQITYTPNPGFLGVDTFTYRGTRASAGLAGDPRTATITVVPGFTLSVVRTGSGFGSVTGNGGAIDCGFTCDAPFAAGTLVTLDAVADPGSFFIGWSGACTGSGSCMLTLAATNTVTANFGAQSAPDAPIIDSAIPGDGQATINFQPPASDGGFPITQYTATCNPGGISMTGASSPIVVPGLVNGTQYACSVVAENVFGPGAASAELNVTPAGAVTLSAVVSRKTHGAAGVQNLPIATGIPIAGAVTVEPRLIGSGHRIVFQFSGPVSSFSSVSVVDANSQPVGIPTTSFANNELVVTLTGIPDRQRVTVSATGVNGSANAQVAIGFMAGDVSSSRAVNAADIVAIKKRAGAVTGVNMDFIFDIDANGTINQADAAIAKSNSGRIIP